MASLSLNHLTVPSSSVLPWTPTLPSPEPQGHLLRHLADALDAASIGYCQWKGHWREHRWATGHGDVDLLVDRGSMTRFRRLVEELGFKAVLPNGVRQVPGLESYFGYDPTVERLLHLHVHYRLLLGDYWRTVYRLPLEGPILATAVPGVPFRIPSPTYHFLVFVLRMVLRQRSRPFFVPRRHWLIGIEGQLDHLEGRYNPEELASILSRHLPTIDVAFFDRCRKSLRENADLFESIGVRRELHRRLRPHSRPPRPAALLVALSEKVLPRRMRPMLLDGRMFPNGGGTTVALVGGDGAGKSTCARVLGEWLSSRFPTRCDHLGLPPRSVLTLLAGAGLKAERVIYQLLRREPPAGSNVELLRHLCTARDRFRLYQKVRRFAVAGGVAICERYPIPQNRPLVGPCIPDLIGPTPGWLARTLRDLEAAYYERILPPDAIFVLRLDPEIAVLRKPDEPADYVRARGRVIWETDWSRTTARVVDASRPLSDVINELKALIWSAV
jgi:hypothetical protein